LFCLSSGGQRIRPKMMTVTTILAGLLPILWSRGTGSDVMKRIAAPMVGGVVTSALLELVVYPALYMIWKARRLPEPRLDAVGRDGLGNGEPRPSNE
jgi:Cu(I)/Ag(I) efflux system membrane protein CusA/SilA